MKRLVMLSVLVALLLQGAWASSASDYEVKGDFWYGWMGTEIDGDCDVEWGEGTANGKGINLSYVDDNGNRESFKPKFSKSYINTGGWLNLCLQNQGTETDKFIACDSLMYMVSRGRDEDQEVWSVLLVEKAQNARNTDVVGEYAYFDHWQWWYGSDAAFGEVSVKADGTFTYTTDRSNGEDEAAMGSWSLDAGKSQIDIYNPGEGYETLALGKGGIMLSYDVDTYEDDDLGFSMLVKKTPGKTLEDVAGRYVYYEYTTDTYGSVAYGGWGVINVYADGSWTQNITFTEQDYVAYEGAVYQHEMFENTGTLTMHNDGSLTIYVDNGRVHQAVISEDNQFLVVGISDVGGSSCGMGIAVRADDPPVCQKSLSLLNCTVDGLPGEWMAVPYEVLDDDSTRNGYLPSGADVQAVKLAYSPDRQRLNIMMQATAEINTDVVYRLTLVADEKNWHKEQPANCQIDIRYEYDYASHSYRWFVVSQGYFGNDGMFYYPIEDFGAVAVQGNIIEAGVDIKQLELSEQFYLSGWTASRQTWARYDEFDAADTDPQDIQIFGNNSDVFTNPYLGLAQVGDSYALAGYGSLAGAYRQYSLIGREKVAGIECLNLLVYGHGSNPVEEFYTGSLAQDIEGNLWLLKMVGQDGDEPYEWQADSPSDAMIFLPAQPIVGQLFSMPSGDYHEVMDTGVTVDGLSTGVGPFADCLEYGWSDGADDSDISWYCPNVGVVLEEWNDGDGYNGWERIDGDPAFATQQAQLSCSKALFKAGRARDGQSDMMIAIVEGFNPDQSVFLAASEIEIELKDTASATTVWNTVINFSPNDIKKGKLTLKDNSNGQVIVKLDGNKQIVQIIAKNLDLTGLACPATLHVRLSVYEGVATLTESVVNSGKGMPVAYLAGAIDTLTVDKFQVKRNSKREDSDKLIVQGTITVAGEGRLVSDILVSYGDYSDTIPVGSMQAKGNKYMYKRGKGEGNSIAMALFDYDKCMYKIVVSNATIPETDGAAEFALTTNEFAESVPVMP